MECWNGGRAQGFSAPIEMLAQNLSGTVGRPVVNKTGLTEKYDWALQWTPVTQAGGPDAPTPADNLGPTIFTALQEQLG